MYIFCVKQTRSNIEEWRGLESMVNVKHNEQESSRPKAREGVTIYEGSSEGIQGIKGICDGSVSVISVDFFVPRWALVPGKWGCWYGKMDVSYGAAG
jgi:hypothetical protein